MGAGGGARWAVKKGKEFDRAFFLGHSIAQHYLAAPGVAIAPVVLVGSQSSFSTGEINGPESSSIGITEKARCRNR